MPVSEEGQEAEEDCCESRHDEGGVDVKTRLAHGKGSVAGMVQHDLKKPADRREEEWKEDGIVLD